MTMVLTIFIKYVLHSVDLQSENPWDNKAVYMLYTELFTGERSLALPNLYQRPQPGLPSPVTRHSLSPTPRLHQGSAVHGFHDHYDQGAHVPPLRHPADVPGHEVSLARPCHTFDPSPSVSLLY